MELKENEFKELINVIKNSNIPVKELAEQIKIRYEPIKADYIHANELNKGAYICVGNNCYYINDSNFEYTEMCTKVCFKLNCKEIAKSSECMKLTKDTIFLSSEEYEFKLESVYKEKTYLIIKFNRLSNAVKLI